VPACASVPKEEGAQRWVGVSKFLARSRLGCADPGVLYTAERASVVILERDSRVAFPSDNEVETEPSSRRWAACKRCSCGFDGSVASAAFFPSSDQTPTRISTDHQWRTRRASRRVKNRRQNGRGVRPFSRGPDESAILSVSD